jgi:hypothetical protein
MVEGDTVGFRERGLEGLPVAVGPGRYGSQWKSLPEELERPLLG